MTFCRASPTPSSRTATRNPASSGSRRPSAPARRNTRSSVDRTKAEALGITVGQVFSALSGYVGSNYVTQFNKFGHVFQVYTQADADKRATVDDIRNLKVRAGNGTMTPIGTAIEVSQVTGPPLISLYNLYPTATVVGSPAPGFSSGQALDLMEQVGAQALPTGTGFDWTAMSYQEKTVGNPTYYVFGFAILLVYLVLAGQYESWILPFAVILAVPLALLGTVAGAQSRRRRQQPLHPDRHHPAHCARQQERHSHRRICAPAARARASRSSTPRSKRRGCGSARSS